MGKNSGDVKMKKLFLNERFIFAVILMNAIVLFVQETGVNLWWINTLDAICTIVFTIEMIVKQKCFGFKNYWQDGWNIMDGTLVILSVPSIFAYLWPDMLFNLSFILVLRLLRVFRFFRVFHLFPNFEGIVQNVKVAIRQCFSVFIGFGILLVVFTLVSCALFSQAAPEYFGTPLESLYSIFKMCTIEGWYDIPDAVASGSAYWAKWPVRLYFISILVSMGIIGMSIINSIFVDAMVSDNNADIINKLNELEKKIDQLNKE